MKIEPTAWLNKERDVITFDNLFPEMTPLYEKREWVRLTDEDKQDWIEAMPWPPDRRHIMVLIEGIEAEIKELNT
jgi:hypothetical protein